MAIALFPGASFAAGIDCTRATAPFDKTICSDPNLLEADKNMTAAYDAIKIKLSPDAQADLTTGQKAWLGFVRKECSKSKIEAANRVYKVCSDIHNCIIGKAYCYECMSTVYDSEKDCILDQYDSRKISLEHALKNADDDLLVLNNKLYGTILPPEKAKGEDADSARKSISYPQIYIPFSKGIQEWNATQRKTPSRDRWDTNYRYETEYKVVFSTSHFISFILDESGQGGGRWWERTKSGLTIMLPSGKQLKGTDIVKPEFLWEDVLSKLVSESLEPDIGENCPGPDCTTSPENLKSDVARTWRITQGGVTVTIDAAGDREEIHEDPRISWQQLKPYLKKEFLAELPPIR